MARHSKLAMVTSLIGFAQALVPPATAQNSEPGPAELKAAIVYNFVRFASWPQARFSNPTASVVLCVSPAERLAPALAKLDGEPVGGRKLAVRATQAFGAACHAAFLSDQEATPERVAALQRLGVLTVGEAPNFARTGAIGLVRVGGQTRFEINNSAARAAGVSLSSQLMRLAMTVRQ